MQPYSDAAIGAHLLPQGKDIESGGRLYRAYCGPGEGFVRETGPDGKHDYAIAQVLGGKNVYYFLTPLERGRLQTLPVAFDVRGRQWFAASCGFCHSRFEHTGPFRFRDSRKLACL